MVFTGHWRVDVDKGSEAVRHREDALHSSRVHVDGGVVASAGAEKPDEIRIRSESSVTYITLSS